MMRVTKDRDTRRAELVEASTALFLEKGFEDTMVSDIVRRVGVAQGTYYYYFKTKEDVLDAALEGLLEEGAGRAARLADEGPESASQRLEGFMRALFSPRGGIEASERYAKLFREPAVHRHMEEVRFKKLHRVLAGLISSGAASGEFKPLRHTEESAEIALRGAAAFIHSRHGEGSPQDGTDTVMDALAEHMERLLGLPERSLDFRDRVIRRRPALDA